MLLAAMMLLGSDAFGQAIAKGDFIIQPNFNLGSHGSFDTRIRSFVPGFTLNLDYAVHDYVTVGGFAGFGGRNNYIEFVAGARGVFQWWQLVDDKAEKDLKSDQLSLYLPVHLGVYFGRIKGFDADAAFNGGAGLGIGYWFNENVGLAFEFGWMEMSWAKIGVPIKL